MGDHSLVKDLPPKQHAVTHVRPPTRDLASSCLHSPNGSAIDICVDASILDELAACYHCLHLFLLTEVVMHPILQEGGEGKHGEWHLDSVSRSRGTWRCQPAPQDEACESCD